MIYIYMDSTCIVLQLCVYVRTYVCMYVRTYVCMHACMCVYNTGGTVRQYTMYCI